MITVAPAGRSVLPDIVGVVSLSEASVSNDTVGAVVSIMPVLSTTVVLLPASSLAVASTLYVPSAKGAGTSTVKFPFASTVAVRV